MRLTSRTWICVTFAIVAFGAAGASAGGLVVNGEFDTDLLGWDNVGTGKVWDPFDDTDDPNSGSISISNTYGGVSGAFVEQCVPVEGGLDYHFSYSHYSTGTDTTGRADVGLYWYSNALCDVSSIGYTPLISLTTGVWTAVATDLSAPAEALGLLVHIAAWKNTGNAGDPWTVYFDHIQLAPEPAATSGSIAALGALASVARRWRARRRLGV